MTDKVEEIRERHELVGGSGSVIHPTGFSWTIPGWVAHADRATLLAEVDRQRAENEKLRDQNKLFRGALDFVAAYRALDFDPQKNLAASHMSIVAREALEGKP